MLAASAIDLQQLQSELQSARGAFDKWASNSVTAADQLRDSHRQNIAQLQGQSLAGYGTATEPISSLHVSCRQFGEPQGKAPGADCSSRKPETA